MSLSYIIARITQPLSAYFLIQTLNFISHFNILPVYIITNS